jgi:hypothetical protein
MKWSIRFFVSASADAYASSPEAVFLSIFITGAAEYSCLKFCYNKIEIQKVGKITIIIMSKTSKIVLWVIVAIIVIGVIVWFIVPRGSAVPGSQGYLAPVSGNVPVSPNGQNVPSTVAPSSTSGGLVTSPTDDSNAALNQDITSINDQLNGLASDSASVTQGLNDQPVPQGQ